MGSSGSRIAFGANGMVYLTTGAPFDDAAQSPDNVYGKSNVTTTSDGAIALTIGSRYFVRRVSPCS